MKNNIYKQQK